MQTPIVDFVRRYQKDGGTRFHMPGHKGQAYLGCEWADITEISGADSLYEADGIIAESEKNASDLFGSGRTFYSTEGSSQCIRAMLYLTLSQYRGTGKPIILAARNVHKAFVYAAALLDFDVKWLWPEEGMKSLCSCKVSPKQIEEQIERLMKDKKEKPAAVYLTSPDYLGGQMDIRAIAEVCHRKDILLLVDNAHGADLYITNPDVITKYQYASNILGSYSLETDDWSFRQDEKGCIIDYQKGNTFCYNYYGISYWNKEDSARLRADFAHVYNQVKDGKEYFWEFIPLVLMKANYHVEIRQCNKSDIMEIDNYYELAQLDPSYR